MQWQKRGLVCAHFQEYVKEFGIVGDGVGILGIIVGYFLPDLLAVERCLVDTRIGALDGRDDGGDEAKASALCDLIFGKGARRLRFRLSACPYDCSTTFEGTELEVPYFAGYRLDKRR